MNDARKLYSLVQQRLIEDGLLRSAVSRVRGEAALDLVEDDFIHWREDTHMPAVIDNYVHNLGRE